MSSRLGPSSGKAASLSHAASMLRNKASAADSLSDET